ncbi:septum formation initiator family protein [Corynebacterium choanae]|uniref:Cell division protein FtsB n=1 Tax=Corynebacterium choanae TaxID=1862358 RepID=A0A3G6J9N2_9CORY|nr:septum formation initiator family protein [Corynebacterium choanae]AZA13150.1 Cell division protein FtsB [Corynebacterium choanae]
MAALPGSRPRRQVPVAHRRVEAAPQRPKNGKTAQRQGFNGLHIAVLMVCLLVIVLMLNNPLQNYFEQRAEIQRLTAEKVRKIEQKEQWLADIERYKDEHYVQEQARLRLGVIAPGERAYRIIAPPVAAPPAGPVTPNGTPTDELGPWWQVMWDSIADPESAPVLPQEQADTAPDSETTGKQPGEQAGVPADQPPVEDLQDGLPAVTIPDPAEQSIDEPLPPEPLPAGDDQSPAAEG